MDSLRPFRVRRSAGDGVTYGAYPRGGLAPSMSEAGIDRAVAGAVGFAVNMFYLRNAEGTSGFQAGLSGDWDAELLPQQSSVAGGRSASSIAGGGASVDVNQRLEKLTAQLAAVLYKLDHVLSEEADRKLDEGAMFCVFDDDRKKPLFCGFFVSPQLAITINHDPMFQAEQPLQDICAFDSSPLRRPLRFKLVATNRDLDFTVLQLVDLPSSAACFPLPPADVRVAAGMKLGFVSMGVGSAAAMGQTPCISQASVTVGRCDKTHISYVGTTWNGDSGAALLLRDGVAVGIHLEVYDARSDVTSPLRSPSVSDPSKRRRLDHDALAAATEVACAELLEQLPRGGLPSFAAFARRCVGRRGRSGPLSVAARALCVRSSLLKRIVPFVSGACRS